MAKYNSR